MLFHVYSLVNCIVLISLPWRQYTTHRSEGSRHYPRSSEFHIGDPQSCGQNESINGRAGKPKKQEFKHIGETAEGRRQALRGRGGKERENRQNEGSHGHRRGRLPQKEINLHGTAPDREKAQEQEIDPCSGGRRGGKPW